MTVRLTFEYPDPEASREFIISNNDQTRMASLGVYIAIGVMTSPDGMWWYSHVFKQPSASDGMVIGRDSVLAYRGSLMTVHHALSCASHSRREWVTAHDRGLLERRVFEALIEACVGATRVTFS